MECTGAEAWRSEAAACPGGGWVTGSTRGPPEAALPASRPPHQQAVWDSLPVRLPLPYQAPMGTRSKVSPTPSCRRRAKAGRHTARAVGDHSAQGSWSAASLGARAGCAPSGRPPQNAAARRPGRASQARVGLAVAPSLSHPPDSPFSASASGCCACWARTSLQGTVGAAGTAGTAWRGQHHAGAGRARRRRRRSASQLLGWRGARAVLASLQGAAPALAPARTAGGLDNEALCARLHALIQEASQLLHVT